jgi:hypothetical protein
MLALYHGEDWLESNCWSPFRQFPWLPAAAWHGNSNVARAAANKLRADVSAKKKKSL